MNDSNEAEDDSDEMAGRVGEEVPVNAGTDDGVEHAVAFIVFLQAEDGIRDIGVTGVQTCALPILELDPLVPDIVWRDRVLDRVERRELVVLQDDLALRVEHEADVEEAIWEGLMAGLWIGRASCRERG